MRTRETHPTRAVNAPVVAIDPKAGLDEAVKAWLDVSSAAVDHAFIVDSKGVFGADLEHTLAGLAGGPRCATTTTNPRWPPAQLPERRRS